MGLFPCGHFEGLLINAFVFDSTNQSSILYSNARVMPPVKFDDFLAIPSPLGNKVLWIFHREPTIAVKISDELPDFLADYVHPHSKTSLYWSDLHVTKLHFIMSKDKLKWYHSILLGHQWRFDLAAG